MQRRSSLPTTDFDRIVASAPIDRTAAIVATGPNVDSALPPLERRKNLVRLVQQLDRAIKVATDLERKSWLGQQKLLVQNLLKDLPRNATSKRNLSAFIADVVKERVSRAEWNVIVGEAGRRADAAEREAA